MVYPLERVHSFDYLGIRLSHKMQWGTHMNKMLLNHKRVVDAIGRDQRLTSIRLVAPSLVVYKGKAVRSRIYGVELWGFEKTNEIVRSKSKFFRDLVSVPTNTPLKPIVSDMGRHTFSEVDILCPILYWIRLRRTPELHSYATVLSELITLDNNKGVKWLKDLKELLTKLGLAKAWAKQVTPTKRELKKNYWNWVNHQVLHKPMLV